MGEMVLRETTTQHLCCPQLSRVREVDSVQETLEMIRSSIVMSCLGLQMTAVKGLQELQGVR